jgi:hypothetical protein
MSYPVWKDEALFVPRTVAGRSCPRSSWCFRHIVAFLSVAFPDVIMSRKQTMCDTIFGSWNKEAQSGPTGKAKDQDFATIRMLASSMYAEIKYEEAPVVLLTEA